MRAKSKKKASKRSSGRQRFSAPKAFSCGRPSEYRPEFCAAVEAFMSQGYSLTAFAGHIGVSRDTIYAWGEAHADFAAALGRARSARTLYWEARLQHATTDARAVIFALRNSCADEWKPDPQVSVQNHVHVNKPPEQWGEAEVLAELKRRNALPVATASSGPRGKRRG